jgi:PAS domain S-box-containing protein
LVLGAIIPWVVNFLYLAGYRPAPGLDPTPVAFVVAGVIYSVLVFRLHLFDLVPVAQDTVVESMRDGVAVVDERGRIVYINPAGRAILNVKDTNPAPIVTALPQWEQITDLLSRSQQNKEELVATEISVGHHHSRRIEVQVSPLRSPQTRSSGHLVLLRDITSLQQTEEQLRLQSVALDAAPNAVIITDTNGMILWVNPAFTTLTGYTLEDAIGNTPRMLKSERHDQAFYHEMWQTIIAGQSWHGEIINRRKDGIIYIEDTTIAPVKNGRGENTHYIAIKQDITARKELEKMRDDLMQAIVHDLRNPLNSILFSLDMAQRLPPIEQVPIEVLSTIEIGRENAWRMLGMINSILDLSRLESGSLPLMLEKVVLAELVEQTIHAQSMIAQRHEVLILNDVPYDLPLVAVDRLLISRVLQNLLDNAIKFTDPGSSIEVNATFDTESSQIIVSIHDEGPGIPSELEAVLFQKFVTGSSPRRGSGLGLAFCRLAVEAHGGKIWAESPKGQGTRFMFALPVRAGSFSENKPTVEDNIYTSLRR